MIRFKGIKIIIIVALCIRATYRSFIHLPTHPLSHHTQPPPRLFTKNTAHCGGKSGLLICVAKQISIYNGGLSCFEPIPSRSSNTGPCKCGCITSDRAVWLYSSYKLTDCPCHHTNDTVGRHASMPSHWLILARGSSRGFPRQTAELIAGPIASLRYQLLNTCVVTARREVNPKAEIRPGVEGKPSCSSPQTGGRK